MKRRDFLDMLMTGGAALLAWSAAAAQERGAVRPVPRARRGSQILVKGGTVLSLDPTVGDFDVADVLIDGATIAAVGPRLAARADAQLVDASHAIVMPGFIDTHRHMWEGSLRNILPNGLLSDYTRDITGAARAVFRPDDAYAGDLVSGLGAINAGVTTVLDWSHIGNSPEHTDAAIAGLRESGVRAVYAFGGGTPGPKNQFPSDIRRLRTQYFSSSDQLLTLAMATATNASDWAVARDVGAPITLHVNGTGSLVPMAALMKPDCTYIHCDNLSEDEWRLIASTGGHVSISGPIEMEMGHGVPPFQQALAHGIRPSLSVDVETQMPGDLFTQMRTAFTLQRMQVLARERAGEKNLPKLLTVRDVVEFATVQGARANALDAKVGTLTPGKQADIILLRHDRLNVLPLNNAYGAVVLDMDTSNVDTVFIAGTMVKSGGQLVGVDAAKVARLAQQSRDYIISKTGWSTSRVR
jgi:cytosine/adenosine deaminase-related metal-dependent hydrolase